MIKPATKITVSFAAFAGLMGCPVEEIPDNEPPVAEITSHYEGQWVDEGFEVVFIGSTNDPDNPNTDLIGTWYHGEEMICEPSAPLTDGSVSCRLETGLPAGESTIRLVIEDPAGNTTESIIVLTVNPTEIPTAEILSPMANDVLYDNIAVTLEGIVRDEEDSSRVLEAWWTSDLDGELNAVVEPDFTGRVAGESILSAGVHVLTLHVVDTTGKEGTDVVDILIGPPNTPPECAFVSPLDSPVLETEELLELSGTATDVDIANTELFVSWVSDLDGLLGASRPNAEGVVLFNTLPGAGQHTLSMIVEDELGATCESTIEVFINAPPIVQIAQPVFGSQFQSGVSVPFSGTLWDSHDVPTALSVSWASDLEGVLHSDPPSANGVTSFNAVNLRLGTHRIKLTVTDTHGSVSEATADISIF